MESRRKTSSSSSHKLRCKFCYEKTRKMLAMHDCEHKICASCARRYLEAKLAEGASLPACTHQGCKARIKIKNCKKVLKPELVEILKWHLKESRIPVQDRIYCPYPKCSYLMSKVKMLEQSNGGKGKGKKKSSDKSMYRRKCLKCGGKFCVECKVSWHTRMTCSDYKKLNPYSCAEDKELASLAKMKSWIQCTKCGHMIERSSGCRNIVCRCGCRLCYCCGAEQGSGKRPCLSSDSSSDDSEDNSSCQCDSDDYDSSSSDND